MKFEPTEGSTLEYCLLNPSAQTLVCTGNDSPSTARSSWGERAAAAFRLETREQLVALVEDILANPQIRALVILECRPPSIARELLATFWTGSDSLGISPMHRSLLRQFVDLYDEECSIRQEMQPFWPERILRRVDDKP